MENLFVPKQVMVLNPEIFKAGAFVTLCYMDSDFDDDGNKSYLEGPSINGVITGVTEGSFDYIGADCKVARVLSAAFYKEGVSNYSLIPVKILGIKQDAK